MNNSAIYWMWLQSGIGQAAKVRPIFENFNDAEDFYRAGDTVWKKYVKSPAKLEKLKKNKPEDFEKQIEFCAKHKIHILCPDSKYYPEQLFEIENYPLVLYIRGDYRILNNSKIISVIGSRTPCKYGEKAAEKIVSRLVAYDYLIVSGGALGIDSVAHKTAIESGGKTVLVMGCGHGSGYLPENSVLRKLVAQNGALISEYPPRHPVTQASFPYRNRIISALSKGVVIVEAADPSGTFSTANHALDQNKDVFVLPGDIDSGNFDGSNRLITEGANPVFSGEDILLYYGDLDGKSRNKPAKNGKAFENIDIDSEFSKKNRKNYKKKIDVLKKIDFKSIPDGDEITEKYEKSEKNCPEGISKNAVIVYNIMSTDIRSVDEISRKSGLDIRKVLVALTELEMVGAAVNDGPGEYCLK